MFHRPVYVCVCAFLLRFSLNNSIHAPNKRSIIVKANADNDKYMERKHVKPVIESCPTPDGNITTTIAYRQFAESHIQFRIGCTKYRNAAL